VGGRVGGQGISHNLTIGLVVWGTEQDIGCCVVESPRALHYYALFSVTRGCDTVLSSHSGSCHEIEQKYTQFVNLETRDTPPRLEMKAFVEALNVLESRARPAGGDEPVWKGERVVDTGPLHRLQQAGETLTKSQRYGHPFERPAVSVPPDKLLGLPARVRTLPAAQNCKPRVLPSELLTPGPLECCLPRFHRDCLWMSSRSCCSPSCGTGSRARRAGGSGPGRRYTSTTTGSTGPHGKRRPSEAIAEAQGSAPEEPSRRGPRSTLGPGAGGILESFGR